MNDIIIHKINEVFFQLQCEESTAIEFSNFLKCFAPGYLFSPKYRLHIWDGRVTFFDSRTRLLPIGLYPYISKFCKKNNYTYSFEFDSKKFRNNLTDEFLEKFYLEIFSGTKFTPRDYQKELIKEALNNKRGILLSATGCHQKGTKILMFSGKFKNIEDIIIGDKLMGPDGKVRNVLKLFSGQDDMYKIKPIKGNDFVVNGEHILHLKYTSGARKQANDKVNISVNDYLLTNKNYKHLTKLVYNNKELEFENDLKNETRLTPYFVGAYLGDGCTNNCGITTMDSEIVEEIKKQINVYGFDDSNLRTYNNGSKATTYYIRTDRVKNSGLGRNRNPIMNDFKKIGLNITNNETRTKCGYKFIPDVFKYGSVEDRYELLAGLIDTDGHLSKKSYYELVSKSEILIDDICFVARSLGFICSKKIKHNKKYNINYFLCNIQGNIQKIPVRINRKKISFDFENRRKQHNLSGFEIEKIGKNEYFGFQLDGDHLYMLDDFLITHNSGKSLIIYAMIRFFLMQKKKVILIVPNIQLVNQMYSDFIEYGWQYTEKNVAKLYNGMDPDLNKPVLISTFQSLAKKDLNFFEKCGAVIVDETHRTKTVSIKNILKNCVNADYRIGVTGTMNSDLCELYTITGYLGPVLKEVKTKELQEQGFLADIKIKNIVLKYPLEFIKENRRLEYDDEKKAIYNNPDRNKVLNLIFSNIPDEQNTLILLENLWHLDSVKEHIEKTFSEKYELLVVHGKIDPEDREVFRQIMESKRNVILLATYGTLSTGVSIKNIKNIVFFASSRGQIRVLQSIGRGLRMKEGKTFVTLWDVVDSLCYRTKSGNLVRNHLFKHWEGDKDRDKLGRLDYYNAQKFEYKTLEKNIVELL